MFFCNSLLAENRVKQIRSNSLADKLQVVVDIERQPIFNVFVLSDPVRLVVDIKARPDAGYQNRLSFKNRGVSLVRTGMRSDSEIRIVLDLVKDFHWEAYALAPEGRRGHRVVIDVFDYSNKYSVKSPAKQAKTVSMSPRADGANVPGSNIELTSSAIADSNIILESAQASTAATPQAIASQTAATPRSPRSPRSPSMVSNGKHSLNKTPVLASLSGVTPNRSGSVGGQGTSKKTPPPQKVVPPKKTTPSQTVANSRRTATRETTAKAIKHNEIVVMIDPGHGGKDSGAVGATGTKEKDIVLQIAKRLKKKIDATANMRAILTRSRDKYISLRGRLALAAKHKPDLFVSIHADAFSSPQAKGSSVFILSTRGASSEAARWLAKRENAVDLKYGVDVDEYDKDVGNMLLNMQQDVTIESGYLLGKKTLSRLKGIGKVHKRRVERAGFAVLKSPDIPSMLVETAFISNPGEEKKLKSRQYQDKIATAIARGISDYFKENLPHHLLLINAP